MLLIRFWFFWLSVLAVCLASPWRVFRSRRRIGRARGAERPEVILIRGAAGGIVPYWPRATALASHLEDCDFAATVINHFEYPRVAREIARAVRSGRLAGGVALVGYSFGADAAALLAELLEQDGIVVDAMVLIESTWGTPVPGNVAHCINYYKTRALDFIPSSRGVAVVARHPRTRLTNINVREHAQLAEIARHSHFAIGDDHRLHRLVGEFIASRRPPELTDTAVTSMAGDKPANALPRAA